MQSTMRLGGTVRARVTRGCEQAPLGWRLRNMLRPSFVIGLLGFFAARLLTRLFGIPALVAELRAVKIARDGRRTDYGVLSRRVVTDAGVAFIVDAFQNLTELENMKYHGVGTGTTAEAAAQTALVAESTTILNPDSTRATGSTTENGASVYRTVGTVTFDGAGAITEHGIFSQAATGGGVLLDRSVFSAINVISGDSIQFDYQLSLSSGG